jgi:putative transposase
VKGRKRHIAVDTLGLLIRVMVHKANFSDRVSVRWLLRRIPFTSRWQRVVVDAGYETDANVTWCRDWFDISYEVVHRTGCGFVVMPRRWVVERTFAWIGKYRRMSKDYEALPKVSEAFIYIASIHILARRLA